MRSCPCCSTSPTAPDQAPISSGCRSGGLKAQTPELPYEQVLIRVARTLLPPPLWGGVGEGDREVTAMPCHLSRPPPPTPPHKGEGRRWRSAEGRRPAMSRWGMLADLERCVGCQTCTAACRHANATSPAVQWRKVLDVEAGAFPDVSRTFVPVGCQHCADPPCVHVCPTTATRQRPDGIVTIDYELCIGCAYCEVACPYQARFLVHEPRYAYATGAMLNESERYDDARLGVAQKCTFCVDRIDFGLKHDLTPGLDPRATPACVNACIADALHFGDLDDPASNVSQLLAEHQHFRMHEELGTAPNFFYLYSKAEEGALSPSPLVGEGRGGGSRSYGPEVSYSSTPTSDPSAQGGGEKKIRIRTKGVEPWHQPHWDWKAAANFLCGGAGAGLFVFAAAASLSGAPMRPAGLFALGLIGVGLALLMFKIGRPLRFVYVLLQPQRSW